MTVRRGKDGARASPLRDDAGAALHHQLYLQLREAIRTRRYPPGNLLPPERVLREEFGVGRITVRRAMERLVAEGAVSRRRGAGTVVESGTGGVRELVGNVEAVMRATTGHVLELGRVQAYGDVATALGIPDGTAVLRAVHERRRDGVPICVLWSWVPERHAALMTPAAVAESPALVLFDRAGNAIGRVEQAVGATIAEVETAAMLAVPTGFPLLRLQRTAWDADGAALEHLVALYRADAYVLRMSLDGGGEGWSIRRYD